MVINTDEECAGEMVDYYFQRKIGRPRGKDISNLIAICHMFWLAHILEATSLIEVLPLP
jgi:hypothetical protein